ncbi:Flp pilus assembly protein CpaB [Profundibacter amoris]|uniref:Flp pilus assembly protein CpaB n=1 Tax=Profundibacter amoris TaxID=2171755 RepID=A0A347UDY5_9RHOB|nr:Flp pilus assembly protein CpaB [Profundibacter amoris]AXX97063.1 Flp pilus assembly protein CpaB [Profundibacter amoris]
MRMVFGLVLILGLGLAGFAVYMTKGYFSDYQAEKQRLEAIANSMVETVNVFVVKNKVTYGSKLTKDDVRLQQWPVDSLPDGVFTFPAAETEDGKPGEDLFPKDSDKLRAVLRTMEAGEPVLAIKVTAPGKDAGITSRLSPGMRAFAIKVDASSGVSGFLRPGDNVDVYWTGRPPNRNAGGNITKLIESGVALIAIDQSANDDIGDANIARTVTVEATPQQVASLAQAQSTGRLSLSLVGVGDATVIDSSIEVDQTTLLDIEDAPVVEEAKEPEKCYRVVRRGTERIEVEYTCPKQ